MLPMGKDVAEVSCNFSQPFSGVPQDFSLLETLVLIEYPFRESPIQNLEDFDQARFIEPSIVINPSPDFRS